MKTWAWIVACALLAGVPVAQAQQVLATGTAPPPPGSALPPPGINDPGAKPQAVPLPSTGIPASEAPAAREAAGHGDSTNVSSQTNADGDKIEEYRRGGKVYMVRITPKHGVTQTYYYDRNSSGSLSHDPQQGPVSPVYYNLYQWGKPHKAPASSADTPAPASGG